MNREDIQFLEGLLYNEDRDSLIRQLKDMQNPLFLHTIAANYNWDEGFDVPKVIVDHPQCDFGTGLLLFYRADGYRLLESRDEFFEAPLGAWQEFLADLYEKLVGGGFTTQNISFTPPLTKVQAFKLRKHDPSISELLLNKSPGEEVRILVW